MAGMEINLTAYFKGIDKYNNMTVSVSKFDRKKLDSIDYMVRGTEYRNDPDFKTPLGPYFIRLKCKDYRTAFNARHLLLNAKLALRVKVRKYVFEGRRGYTYTIVKGNLFHHEQKNK